jgi:hypothetical protein
MIRITILILLLFGISCKSNKMANSTLTEKSILDTLDNSNDGYYCHFLMLDEAYSYLIDCRLNIFSDNKGNWAIAAERLGYNPRAGGIVLTIQYFGNCLQNLEEYNNRITNTIYLNPTDDSFYDTVDNEALKKDAQKWIVHGKEVKLSHNKKDYENANIQLAEYEPNEIRIEEAARLSIIKYRDYFRATDIELYRCIPINLQKILILDEWHHKDFSLSDNLRSSDITDEMIKQSFEQAKDEFIKHGIDLETFKKSIKEQKENQDRDNKEMIDNNSPSKYETWNLIAKVIVTGDKKYYRPKLKPNTHWSNYPNSGNL